VDASPAGSPPPDTEDEGPPRRRRGDPLGLIDLVRDLLRLDRAALVILVMVPVALTLLDYYGMPWHWSRYEETHTQLAGRRMQGAEPRIPPMSRELIGSIDLPGPPELQPFVWWGLACLVTLILMPLLAGALVGRSPRSLGLRLKGTGREAPTYLVLYLVFLPVVWMVSRWPGFLATYPFFPPARQGGLTATFWTFEAIYCLQFLGIELFFRGFIVLGLKPSLGRGSILAMLAPYCMIHYYKPMPEALGAIGAGLVLGSLAWRSGTIVYGWLLHFAVALSMDLLALHARGVL
jgi:hypothetical protein